MTAKGNCHQCCRCDNKFPIGTGDFSLILGILHMYGHAQVCSHVFLDMDCNCLFSVQLVAYSKKVAFRPV